VLIGYMNIILFGKMNPKLKVIKTKVAKSASGNFKSKISMIL